MQPVKLSQTATRGSQRWLATLKHSHASHTLAAHTVNKLKLNRNIIKPLLSARLCYVQTTGGTATMNKLMLIVTSLSYCFQQQQTTSSPGTVNKLMFNRCWRNPGFHHAKGYGVHKTTLMISATGISIDNWHLVNCFANSHLLFTTLRSDPEHVQGPKKHLQSQQ